MSNRLLHLGDPFWRLDHFYKCKKEGGGEVPFRLRDQQRMVLKFLYDEPDVPLYIIKSRRLGLSTGLGLGIGDRARWTSGFVGKILERSQAEATEKLDDMVKFSHLSMPPELLERFQVFRDNNRYFETSVAGMPLQSRSRVEAIHRGRGGDCGALWISEAQIIAADGLKGDKRFGEIRSGAWESARRGWRVVETTWMGGKGGQLWEMIKPVLELDPASRGRVLFCPWYDDPECRCFDGGVVSDEVEDYFRELEGKTGRRFDPEQKRFYQVTKLQQGIFMTREYPSTLAEAFSAPVKGSIYAGELLKALTEKRIGQMPVDGGSLVHTFWDLGSPSTMVCWYAQVVGREIRLIDVDRNAAVDFKITERVAQMLARGYSFGKHFLPHDGGKREYSGSTLEEQLLAAGLKNVVRVPRAADKWIGINHVLQLFPSLAFRLPQCQGALDALTAYRTDEKGLEPVHDWSSHTADALRTLGEAHKRGMFEFKWVSNQTDNGFDDEKPQRRRRQANIKDD